MLKCQRGCVSILAAKARESVKCDDSLKGTNSSYMDNNHGGVNCMIVQRFTDNHLSNIADENSTGQLSCVMALEVRQGPLQLNTFRTEEADIMNTGIPKHGFAWTWRLERIPQKSELQLWKCRLFFSTSRQNDPDLMR